MRLESVDFLVNFKRRTAVCDLYITVISDFVVLKANQKSHTRIIVELSIVNQTQNAKMHGGANQRNASLDKTQPVQVSALNWINRSKSYP
jgi:hypothetical protein